MPLFGKRRNEVGKLIFKKEKKGLVKGPIVMSWKVDNSELKVVNSRLGKRLTQLVSTLPKRTSRPNIVVDWGCGMGKALFELAKQNPDKVFVGFSDQSHPSWLNRPKNVFLLHTTTQAIEKLASYKSVMGKVDLMYTHFGLQHLTPSELTKHLNSIKKVFPIGGKIIMKPDELNRLNETQLEEFGENAEKNGYKVTFQFHPHTQLNPQNNTLTPPKGINPVGIIELERIR